MAWRLGVRKGDQVKVIGGRDKGKRGRVLSVNPGKDTCTVEHVNMVKRHTRPNPAKQIKGGIVEREGPIHASNVQLVCSSCSKTTRVRHQFLADGSKVRACQRCGATLDH
ncbi:MAG: 50S ribosomal protein L24 [Acidobacteria bacterium]|nr:50S ribosomal protein L24 [Acidobacteriota bacterium]